MKTRYNKITTSEGPRYIVEVRKNIFSNWERQRFSFIGGRSNITELTIEEIGCVCNWYCSENREIDHDIHAYLDEQERERHRKPYHITKYRDEHSRIIDTLCMAESLEDLYEQLGKLIEGQKHKSEEIGKNLEVTPTEPKKFLYATQPFRWRKTEDGDWDEYEYPAGTKVEIIGTGPRGYDVKIVETGVKMFETGLMEWSSIPITIK